MCSFLSALVTRDDGHETVLTHPLLDSHTDLALRYGLSDVSVTHPAYARVELSPRDDGDWTAPEKWAMSVEQPTPVWWDNDVAARVRATLEARVGAMILTGHVAIIADGCWILGGSASVDRMIGGRVVCMFDSASVVSMSDSARVGDMFGSARVGDMSDSASVGNMSGSARVGNMFGSARVPPGITPANDHRAAASPEARA